MQVFLELYYCYRLDAILTKRRPFWRLSLRCSLWQFYIDLYVTFISYFNKKVASSNFTNSKLLFSREKKRRGMSWMARLAFKECNSNTGYVLILLLELCECVFLVLSLRIEFWYLQHETELLEDTLGLPGFPPATTSYKFGSSDEEFMDSDDYTSTHVRTRPPVISNSRFTNSNLNASQHGGIKQEVRRRHSHHNWLHKLVKPFSYQHHLSHLSLYGCYSLITLVLPFDLLRILMNRWCCSQNRWFLRN